MANLPKRAPQSPFDYVLEKAEIRSDVFEDGVFLDIKNVITDIEIFEHLDKPYLTGTIIFVDDSNIYNTAKFSGAERLLLKVRLPSPSAVPTEKLFVIEKVLKSVKTNDNTSVIAIHLIEEHAFVAQLKNVNKSYTGKPTEVIQKIITDNLGREFSEVIPDNQEPIRVIVPNLDAISAAHWVRDKTTSVAGTPYYLFSTFANKRLHLMDLADMLQAPVDETPYWYSQINTQLSSDMGVAEQSYIIQSYKSKNTDAILPMIKKGNVGAVHSYYNPLNSTTAEVKLNINDTFEDLKQRDIIAVGQNKLSYRPEHKENGVPLHEMIGARKTNIAVSNTYNDVNNYTERSSSGSLKQQVVAEALRDFLVKDSMEVVLPGRNFLQGDYSNTIGNQVQLRFLNNSPNTAQIDTKKSGDYLIYACKHVFKKERYDVIISGVKLADIEGENELG